MTIRAKLLVALAAVVFLVVAQGLVDTHYASATRGAISQLGKATVSGKAAARGMLDALSKLEICVATADESGTPGNQFQVRKQGEVLFGEFRGHLNAMAASTRLEAGIRPPDQPLSKKDSGAEQSAQLRKIGVTLDEVEAGWRNFTNLLTVAPAQARFVREHALLPAMNEELRPQLAQYDQLLNDAAALEVTQILQQAGQSERVMLLMIALAALAVLAAFLILARRILDPVRQFAAAARDAAGGDLPHRRRLARTGEFRGLADTFNHVLDVLQSTAISRNELEETARARAAELKNEISLRQGIEAEWRVSEQILLTTLNSIGGGLLIANAAGRVVRMNPVAEQFTGWDTQQAFGRPVEEVICIINEHTRQPVVSPVAEALAQDKTARSAGPILLVQRNGTECPIVDSCSSTRDPEGKITGAVLFFRDVTEERQAGEQLIRLNRELEQRVKSRTSELGESERRHRTLLANVRGMAYRCRNDRDRTMESLSQGCRALLGVEPETLTGGRIAFNDLIHPEDRKRVWNEVQDAVAKECAFALEYRVKQANGGWRSVWEQGRAVLDGHGQVAALEGYVTDITERVEAERARRILEEQLRQAQKLEAVGALAGGIAHDFNNLLAAILGSAELLKMDFGPDHPNKELLEQIFTAGNRARELVRQILMFSRRKDSEQSIISLQPVVEECLKLLRSTIPAMVEIKHHIDPDCLPVLADPVQIHQVVMNLCTNAWHALPERGGRIEVALGMCEIGGAPAAPHRRLRAGMYVELVIQDNGAGMDKATLERIFEPFFTTKPAGKGSGLGLSVVHGIVQAHDGAIVVESEPGKGTTFTIYLPAQASPNLEIPHETKTIFRGSGEHILLVDDEELSGRAMEKLFIRLGYRVSRFTHPQNALAKFDSMPAQYDMVVSDLSMPSMSGGDLAGALLKVRSNIPILLVSGLMDQRLEELARCAGARKVLLKPVAVDIFAREIAQVLAGPAEI